ncbi:hypothetical protein ACS0TY_007100 [Phlomoides rotata]
MHSNIFRSSSYNSGAKASDEFLVSFFPAAATKGLVSSEDYYNYNYNPISDDTHHTGNKDHMFPRSNPGEKAVHLIPLVLLLSAFLLWWFSNPVILP